MVSGRIVLAQIIIEQELPKNLLQKKQILPSESAKENAEYCSPRVIAIFLQKVRYLTNTINMGPASKSEVKARIYEKAGKIISDMRKNTDLFAGEDYDAIRLLKQDGKIYPQLIALLDELTKQGCSLDGVSEKAWQLLNMLEKI